MALALIRQLPLDSAFVTAVRGGPEYSGWDRPTYVMADLYDAINALTYLFQMSNSDKPKKVEPFPAYPRPGVKAEEKSTPKPNPLLARLRGVDGPVPPNGPGSKVPLPPSRP
ncbi:hypothetical protein [Streptosporangium subroseum]|uniref:hypothetical protein n=1 Tax=Streptosporangium subroseum TaxID=106412 RepID=UPI00308DEF34|nr:hypothetical protein OHB15_14125 [Streptosporangium subroseum]